MKDESPKVGEGSPEGNATRAAKVADGEIARCEPANASAALAERLRQEESAPRPKRLPIVGIGASAGGLEALQAFFSGMPAHSGIGFVVVTHVSPQRPSLLPELLANVTKLRVAHAEDAMRVESDLVLVAKDSLLSIEHGALREAGPDPEPEPVAHHPIDHFLRVLAHDQREHAIGLILSGSGNDGVLGAKAIKAAGGMVMVQDPQSAKYSGMPGSVIASGLADYVLPAADLPAALIDYCNGAFLRLGHASEHLTLPEDAVRAILVRLRARTGHDFTCYKRSTISRRIERRMNLRHIDKPQDYLRLLSEQTEEIDHLLQDLLISVTSFFRDPDAFAALAEKGIPRLLAERGEGDPLRVWVAGCATGEEAYSVAILLDEEIRRAERVHELQIFATDIDIRAIDVARQGLYPAAIAADVSPERLAQYFTPEGDAYRIRKDIRDTIVFAVQNLVSDPPFTRIDLVVCRNVLIYLNGAGQQRVLPTLHYALRPGGLLFLGSSEASTGVGELFETVDPKHKVLRQRDVPRALPLSIGLPAQPATVAPPLYGPAQATHLARAVERLLLERFAPCCVVVDEGGTIVYLQGRCGLYLEPEQGQPRNNLLEMVREGGSLPLSAALNRACREQREVVRRGVRVRSNGGQTGVDITVSPLAGPEVLRGLVLVALTPSAVPHEPAEHSGAAPAELAEREDLTQELRFTRESLSSTIEQLQTANEELRSSNEELQSTNEELHSSNEELETSREEMQSMNEELNTVNAELQSKIDALTRASDDMRNLLNSIEVATVFLDEQLRVKRYTERARDLVRFIASDIGRPLSDLTVALHYPELIADCQRVLTSLVPVEKEVLDDQGRWRLVRLIPYRRADNVIDGLVLTMVDIDRTKQAERRAQAAREYFESIVQTVREPTLILDGHLRVVRANDSFYRVFATQPKQVEQQPIYQLGNGQWDLPSLRELLERILPERAVISDFRVAHAFPHIGERVFMLNARRLPVPEGGDALIVMAFEDVTPRRSE